MSESELSFYPNSIAFCRDLLEQNYPGISAREGLEDVPSHLLWMLDRVEALETPAKRGRWIGYVLGRMEALGLMENSQSRDITRADGSEGKE